MQTLKAIPETRITVTIPVQKKRHSAERFLSHITPRHRAAMPDMESCELYPFMALFYVFFYMYIWIFPEIYCTI